MFATFTADFAVCLCGLVLVISIARSSDSSGTVGNSGTAVCTANVAFVRRGLDSAVFTADCVFAS